LDVLRQQTAADAKAVVDHTFKRILVLVLVLVCGALLAALLYRFIANRLNP
jgi:hypothetical protein